jgi:sugar lactone lactonase YvrE
MGFSGDNGPATQAMLGTYLAGMARDALGNLYIADAGNARIRKVDRFGVITTYAGNGTAGHTGDNGPALQATLNGPSGVAVDAAGNVYFAEFNNDCVRKIDTQGTISTYASLPDQPTGLAIDGAGNLYVAMWRLEKILRIDTARTTTTFAGTGAQGYSGDHGPATSATLANPNGVWMDAKGILYIADNYNHVVRKVDAAGTITTFAGNGKGGYSGDEGPATSAALDVSYGIVSDGVGNVYLSDTTHNVVRYVDPAGIIHTVAGTGTSGFTAQPGPALATPINGPVYLWMAPDGTLYFSDLSSVVAHLTR